MSERQIARDLRAWDALSGTGGEGDHETDRWLRREIEAVGAVPLDRRFALRRPVPGAFDVVPEAERRVRRPVRGQRA